jgi:hypothetical protein
MEGMVTLIDARDAVVWVNNETREIRVRAKGQDWAEIESLHWCDPIGAAHSDWKEANNKRVLLMLETAIDLAMQGIDLGSILRAFAEVKEFRALGSVSYPMCRALTSALVGQCLEPNTMSFESLLEHYGRRA